MYFSKIQEWGKEGLALHFEKGKVLIVCYSTTFSTTHAVCWDIDEKKILDSECRNNEVFTYTSFDNDSQVAKSIAEALSTTINVPCIFSIAYWKKKVMLKENVK